MNIFKRRANAKVSAANLDAWLAAKTDWDDAKKQDFMDKIRAIFSTLADGKISEAELEQFAHMIYFDDAVAQAREEGVVVGRNNGLSLCLPKIG